MKLLAVKLSSPWGLYFLGKDGSKKVENPLIC